MLGFGVRGNVERDLFPDAERSETACAAHPIAVIRRRDDESDRRVVGVRFPYQHQALRIRVGKRAQEQRVEEAEDSRARANADGKHEDGQCRVTGSGAKQSERVGNIAHHSGPEPGLREGVCSGSPPSSNGLGDGLNVLELALRDSIGSRVGVPLEQRAPVQIR